MTLAHPYALFTLVLLVGVALADRFTLVDFSRRQRALSFIVRALFVVALALALARPERVFEDDAITAVALVDVSDSISDAQLAKARTQLNSLRTARRKKDVLRLVTFGEHPRVVPLPDDGAPLPEDLFKRHDGTETDLASALALASALYPPNTLRRAIIFSDGVTTRGDLGASARTLAEAQITTHYVALAASQEAPEVLVRRVQLPERVSLGAPFAVTAEIYATHATSLIATLYRDEFVNPLEGQKQLTLVPGRNLVTWKSEVTRAGATLFKVMLSGKFPDRFANNNSALAVADVEGRPRVLYIEGSSASSASLAAALGRENIDVETRGPTGLPRSARELQAYDLVLLSDVASTFVGPDHQAALEHYVKDVGGGFIMAGGENSFGSGGYGGTRIEQLLPVRFDGEKKRDQPRLALALVIDRSGSMSGEKIELAKEAARATAELLGSDDLIAVIAFDSIPQSLVRMQRAASRTRIASDISKLQPGGGTAILPALREAYEQLGPIEAKVKHVILLTDGQAAYDGIPALVDDMAAHRITVSGVGVGSGADKTLLTMIAERGGGRFYFTEDASNVPKIFMKETQEAAKSALVESAVTVRVIKHVELLDGVGMPTAPPLGGYVTTRMKPSGELILASDRGDPILARWRIGLGQAVAFTSDVKNRWAARWLSWPGYQKFWAHLVRSTMRQDARGHGAAYELSSAIDGDHATVRVDAISSDGRFVSGLDGEIELSDVTKTSDRFRYPLREIAPGRYESDFRLARYGAFLVRATQKRDGVVVAESTGTLSLSYPREYLAQPADETSLAALATATQAKRSPTDAEVFSPGVDKRFERRALWPWFLWAAALLLLLDVALRRIRIA